MHAMRLQDLSTALLDALFDLSRAASERELHRRLTILSGEAAGIFRATLLTRTPRWTALSRASRLRREEQGKAARKAPPELLELIGRGAPAVFLKSQLAELGCDPDATTELAALVPCAGRGSAMALLVEWQAPAPDPGPPLLERLRLVALVAGQTLQRLDAEHREHLARADMENRIKNTIAVVRSVAARSAHPAASLEEFSLHFEGRLDAMARVQIAFTRSGPRVQLEQLVEEELFSQGIGEGRNVSIRGMEVSLDAPTAETLCLALHELAVNAVKFGAFADAGGSLVLRWWLEVENDMQMLRIRWTETTPFPTEPDPDHYGFGRTLLERVLPFELDARTRLTFGPPGMRCNIALPVPAAGRPSQRLASGFPLRQSWIIPSDNDG